MILRHAVLEAGGPRPAIGGRIDERVSGAAPVPVPATSAGRIRTAGVVDEDARRTLSTGVSIEEISFHTPISRARKSPGT